jgi:hypothetical protein
MITRGLVQEATREEDLDQTDIYYDDGLKKNAIQILELISVKNCHF